jgi:hypothetical protein
MFMVDHLTTISNDFSRILRLVRTRFRLVLVAFQVSVAVCFLFFCHVWGEEGAFIAVDLNLPHETIYPANLTRS